MAILQLIKNFDDFIDRYKKRQTDINIKFNNNDLAINAVNDKLDNHISDANDINSMD